MWIEDIIKKVDVDRHYVRFKCLLHEVKWTNKVASWLISATSNSILDRALDSEEAQHKDFLRLVKTFLPTPFFSLLPHWKPSSRHKILQEHVEGYHELSAKTKIFFATAVAKWDADFYVKVDDDVHVNLGNCPLPLMPHLHIVPSKSLSCNWTVSDSTGTFAATLARHRSKPRVYIGCMKSGPVLAQK